MPRILPQACYVVTSRNKPELLVMTHAAILTLRHNHPEVEVHVLVDTPTSTMLRREYSLLANANVNVVTVDTGLDDAPASSRFIKTTLRDRLEGEFIYLDIDTVVLRELWGLLDHKSDIAAVEYDFYRGGNFPGDFCEKFDQIGWERPIFPYLNSGVLHWRDNERTRLLSHLWHKYWIECRDVMGNTDQPPLNRAMRESEVSVHLLAEDFNQTVRDLPQKMRVPHVIHYTTSAALNKPYVLINHLMRYLETHGELDVATLERCRDRNDPWVSAGPGIKGNWHTGRYWAAGREALKRLGRRSKI